MSFKKFAVGVSIGVCGSFWVAAGCGGGDNGAGGDDSGSDVTTDHKVDAKKDTGTSSSSSSSGGDDSGDDSGGTCSVMTPFMAAPWVGPEAFGQGACTDTQAAALVTAFADNNMFSAWLMDPNNAACAACAVPQAFDAGQTAAGAVLVYPLGGGMAVRAPNFGGCVAGFDGMKQTGACGEKIEDWNICLFAECNMCSDYSMPTKGGPFSQCQAAADADMTECKPFLPSASCIGEIQSGPGMVCNMFNAAFVQVFCGPGDGGLPDSGSDATVDSGDDGASDAAADAGGG
jgi:hypothetical protein